MFDAIHKKTNKGWYAAKIWDEFSNPHDEEWVCCPICKLKVTPVIKHYRNEKMIFVPSHFRIMKNNKKCISYESDEHKMGKIIIANLIENKEINFTVKHEMIRLKFQTVPEIKYRWEVQKGERRADILFELEKYNSLIGNGVVIEIAVSEKEKSLEMKTRDWIKKGYSVCWLYAKDFSENSYRWNDIEIKYPFGLYRDIIKMCNSLTFDYHNYDNWYIFRRGGLIYHGFLKE